MHLTLPGSTADALVGCAYLLWIAVTLGGLLRWRMNLPILACIFAPSWPLFAPYPIVYNYELAFRAKHGDGNFSPWRQLPRRYGRALHHALWNPGFSEQLFLCRLCQALVEVPETEPGVERLRARAYDLLAALAVPQLGEQPESIQFRIRRSIPLIPDRVQAFLISGDEQLADAS
jgi:hypothetical protein